MSQAPQSIIYRGKRVSFLGKKRIKSVKGQPTRYDYGEPKEGWAKKKIHVMFFDFGKGVDWQDFSPKYPKEDKP